VKGIVGLVAGALLLHTGCGRRPAPATAQAEAPAFTPDSVRRAQLDSFLVGTGVVTELEGGATSQEELVRGFVSALQTRDTSWLRAMTLSRAEFGRLYYPTNPQAKPPYDLEPRLFWFMLSQHSAKGLGKALDLLGGTALRYGGHRCDSTVSREGENTVYGPCVVRLVQGPGDTMESRIFSLLLERHGRWKFVSYANRLE
jgi:hypothetical protein